MRSWTKGIVVGSWLISLPWVAAAATLNLRITNNGEPLNDPTLARFYVYEPGERESYLAWGHGAKAARFPDGTYDLVIRYRNDMARSEIVREEVELAGEVEQEIDFQVPLATLTLDVTSGGQPVNPYTARYRLFASGRRDKPVVARRPGSSVTLRPGFYDIEISVRDLRGMKSTWIDHFPVDGTLRHAVEIGAPPARLRVTLLRDGIPLGERDGFWRVFHPGDRDTPLAEVNSGQAADLEPGTYDVGIFFRDGAELSERWMESLRLDGELHRQVELSRTATRLRVDIRREGASEREAWFVIHPAGDRRTPLASAGSGETIEIEPGTYDIGCFLRRGGLRAERWLTDQRISGASDVDVDLTPTMATLRVLPPSRRRRAPRVQAKLLLILDSSAQMADEWGDDNRIDSTVRAIQEVLRESRRSEIDVGLRAYGIAPLSQQDCRDSSLLAPPSSVGARRLVSTLELLRPAGLSPIAFALDAAGEDLSDDDWNTVVLVTGSVEGCAGDPCDAAVRLVRRGLAQRVHVIGLGLDPVDGRSLDCIGKYQSVRDRRELRTALRQIFGDATETDRGTVAVFRPDGGEWLATAAIGERLELSAGTYDVLIRYGGQSYTWQRVAVSGAFESAAGSKPSPR